MRRKSGPMLRVTAQLALVAAAGCWASMAHAGLMGDTVNLDYLFPDQSTVFQDLGTATVSPTATFNSFGQTQYVVSDTTFEITNVFGNNVKFTSGSFNGVELTDLTSADIASVTVDPATNLAGFGAANVSFDSGHIFINLQSLVTAPDTLVKLDIVTVPEPATLALLGLGLAALGFSRRKQ